MACVVETLRPRAPFEPRTVLRAAGFGAAAFFAGAFFFAAAGFFLAAGFAAERFGALFFAAFTVAFFFFELAIK